MKKREIKFRVWHEELRIFFYYLPQADGSSCWITNNNGELVTCSYDLSKYELLQFIGLKDVKGNEIYEEDICEIEDEYFKIYFNERSAGFQLSRLGMHEGGNEFISNVIAELEVVGNTYENPEIANDDSGFKMNLKL